MCMNAHLNQCSPCVCLCRVSYLSNANSKQLSSIFMCKLRLTMLKSQVASHKFCVLAFCTTLEMCLVDDDVVI